MNGTSTHITPENVVPMLLDTLAQSLKNAVNILWQWFLGYLADHWLYIGLILFVVFVVVTIKAMFGRWGALGSFLYNFFYFGTLFIIGIIWGPEFFVSDWFGFFTMAVLYPVCYFMVGKVLNYFNFK